MPIRRTDSDATFVTRAQRSEEDDRARPQPTTLRATPQAIARHVEEVPASTEYLAFIANVAASAELADARRDAAVRAKLDAVRDAFSGPYLVNGSPVTARPMFRMTTHPVPKAMAFEVDALGNRAGVRAPFESRVGQGKPQDLVKITQALIDAGRLPSGPGSVSACIRKMQWDYGIGVDCGGYAKQALAACAARPPELRAAGSESFRDLDGARASHFAKVPIERARPGDLVTLDPDPASNEVWGHNVVVYSHAVEGSLHILQVDSSWGAGTDGAECGGFRRDTWLYDAASKTWASVDPTTGAVEKSTVGPAGDAYHGTYRPR